MRPQSIVMFERLFLAALALSVLTFALGYETIMASVTADPTMRQAGLGSGFLIGALAVEYALYLALWYLIARRGANWAKWVFLLVLAISLTSLPRAFGSDLSLTVLLGLAVQVLRILSAVYLFRPDAAAWLRGDSAETSAPDE
jgi:hypothetical protein